MTALSIFAVGTIATVETALGSGPFTTNTPTMNAVLLDLFFGVVSVTGLVLVAAIAEREDAERERERAVGEQAAMEARLQDAKALQESAQRWRLAAQAGKMYAYEWDVATDTVLRSGEVATVLGTTGEVSHLTRQQLLARVHPDDRALFLASSSARTPDNPDAQISYRMLRPDGSVMWLEKTAHAFFDERGKMVRMIGMVADITERKLAEETRFKHAAILESSEDAIIAETLDGVITSWNAGAQHIFGYTEAEMLRQPITILVPLELRDEENRILQRLRAGERVEHLETTRLAKSGKKVDVSLTTSPIKDARGRVVAASTILRDVTERRRAEEALKNSEEKFSKAFRESPMALTLTSAKDHRYLDVNETFERLSGWRRDEVIGRTPLDIGIWGDPTERVEIVKRALFEGGIRDAEVRYRRKDGAEMVGLGSAELILIGNEPCVLSVIADITERKRAEQALKESEIRFRLLADTAPVLIWMSGTDRLCNYFNKPWLNFTGRSIEEELGNGWTEGIHPQDLQRCLHTYAESFHRREDFGMEYRLRRHDGEYRWILDIGVPRYQEDGSFAGYIGSCVDITTRKEAEDALSGMTGKLIEAQEQERARIARELHDDINQRLALLTMELEQVQQQVPDSVSEVRTRIGALQNETTQISSDVQKMSHELHSSKLEYLGIAAAVKALCKEFGERQKVEIDFRSHDVPSHLPPAISVCLFRIAQEALQNAVKHSGVRHFEVQLGESSGEIHLSVSDTGKGFDSDAAMRGSGLGLTSMRERLKLVNGQLSIDSQRDRGTTVHARVPFTPSAEPARAAS